VDTFFFESQIHRHRRDAYVPRHFREPHG
jgi:hypothetical protein